MSLATRIDAAIAAARREDGLLRLTDTCTQQTWGKVFVRRPDLQAQVVKRPRGTKQVYQLIAEQPLRRLLSHMPLNQILVRGESTTMPAAALLSSDTPAETQANAPTEPVPARVAAPEDAHETIAPEQAPMRGDSSDAPQTPATLCLQPSEPSPSVTARQFSGGGMNFIVERRSDGYLNATVMCKAHGKLFADYARTDGAAAYLDAVAKNILENSSMENHILDFHAARASLVQSQNGGPHRGTWVHDLVAVHLAQWLSPAFAVWVSSWALKTAILPAQARSAALPLAPPARHASSSSSTDIQRFSIPCVPRPALKVHEMPSELDTPSTQHDLYLMLVSEATATEEHLFWKIGRGHDPTKRETECAKEVRRKGKLWKHETVCIWRCGGALEKAVQAEFESISGFIEYFEGDEDFPERVQEAVQLVLPKALEKQHQRKRKALEELERGQEAAAFDREFKRRKMTLDLDREAASIATANAAAADIAFLRELARDDAEARAVFLHRLRLSCLQ